MQTLRHSSVRTALTVAFAVALALTAAPAMGQSDEAAVPELDREELETRAEAFLDVNDIQVALQSQLETAVTPEEAQALQQSANDEMLKTLDDHGLTPEEYTETMNATQEDTDFRERFIAAVNQLQEERSEEGSDR